MPYKSKLDQAKAARKHYLKNKDVIKRKAHLFTIQARKRNYDLIAEYKKTHPCVDCGIIFPDCAMDFDHIKGKKFHNIALLANAAYSWETILKEIEKCEVRCANCHRIKTWIKKISRDGEVASHQAHNLKIASAILAPATKIATRQSGDAGAS